ncbi:xanthine dehydrogenase family protein molybdopterin-binding subunit [Cyclobacterium marinum]|uniref:xanthine dehydrogenase family protein molybdopterin-binding subunit n=1 Tax=Cyclobacterium marinum TaxID=104 RepID=UPI0011F0387F|nr:molybdopterin cofactor-binding domain-containing protein [Cyclobacterium marinum]MBI0401766.1 xanthine dehydrogenase family protein molybdopterin-binding subunit [Cyclobacterium marinum]
MTPNPDKYLFPTLSDWKSSEGGMSRRKFFKLMGAGAATYILFTDVFVSTAATADDKFEFPDKDLISSWIHISDAGKITVFTGKVEIGQNIRTSLSQVVAEELSVAPQEIKMIMGDTSLTPYDRGTYGSLTTLQISPILRLAAANLKGILLEEAETVFGVATSQLQLKDGKVLDVGSAKSVDFGALLSGKKVLRKINKDVSTIAPAKWKVAGQSISKINGKDFINGSHKYVSDMVLPNMVYGKILRAPAYGAKLLHVETTNAEKIPGVMLVRDGDFIGLVADSPGKAAMALAAIDCTWGEGALVERAELFEHLIKTSKEGKSKSKSLEDSYEGASLKINQRFEIDYIAHVPLETRAAIAHWKDGEVEVWAGTQRPFGLHEDLAKEFGLPLNKIRVHVPDTGSGYGGKQSSDVGIEAAKLSKKAGRPVKVCWTREEEFKWAYFRPAGVIEVKASVNQGKINTWEFHNYNSGAAGIDFPYSGAQEHLEYHRSSSPLRQGSYRALSSTANIFAIESIVNDLARDLKYDPLQFRIAHLEKPRLIDVIKAGAEAFSWGKEKSQAETGFGMACGTVKGGFVATFVEVKVESESRKLNVRRVVTAFECGVIINPRHLKSQVVGCVLQGLGGALFEAVDFKDAKLTNPGLTSYRVPRFSDVPEMKVILLNREDLPSSGAGEAPIVCIAPALRNAIQDACGVKLYKLPMLPSGVVPDHT